MGRAPCCSKVGLHRGPWTPREDNLLIKYIQTHGEGHWKSLPTKAGLLRCGKSCRLRWMNYLRPDIKRGNITPDEDDLIIRLHSLLGNRWSLIAGRLPGRTDNEIKNYWNTHLSKKLLSQGTDPITHKKLMGPVQEKATRKRSSRNTKANSKNKAKAESETVKVHLPKPFRIAPLSLPRNNSFECNTLSIASSSHGGGGGGGGEGGLLATEVVQVPRPDGTKDDGQVTGFLFGYDDLHFHMHDRLVINNSSDLEFHPNSVPVGNEGSLEKLYEEYLELLKTSRDDQNQPQLDSFTESLLI
ncbi:hypothetical protein SLE2022_181800 [Rubroshorea leprosula]